MTPNQTVTISVTANVDSENVNKAITLLQDVANSGVFKDYSASIQVGAKIATIDDSVVQNYIATEKTANGKVIWSNDATAVNDFKNKIHEATGRVKWGNDSTGVKTFFEATGNIVWNNSGLPDLNGDGDPGWVNGTANINGSAFANGTVSGRAFAHGDWGVKSSGVALGGELGRRYCDYT